MTSAKRQRLHKGRIKRGERVLEVCVRYNALIEVLLESNRLSEAEALDPRKVEVEAAEDIHDWIARYHEEHGRYR